MKIEASEISEKILLGHNSMSGIVSIETDYVLDAKISSISVNVKGLTSSNIPLLIKDLQEKELLLVKEKEELSDKEKQSLAIAKHVLLKSNKYII